MDIYNPYSNLLKDIKEEYSKFILSRKKNLGILCSIFEIDNYEKILNHYYKPNNNLTIKNITECQRKVFYQLTEKKINYDYNILNQIIIFDYFRSVISKIISLENDVICDVDIKYDSIIDSIDFILNKNTLCEVAKIDSDVDVLKNIIEWKSYFISQEYKIDKIQIIKIKEDFKFEIYSCDYKIEQMDFKIFEERKKKIEFFLKENQIPDKEEMNCNGCLFSNKCKLIKNKQKTVTKEKIIWGI